MISLLIGDDDIEKTQELCHKQQPQEVLCFHVHGISRDEGLSLNSPLISEQVKGFASLKAEAE